MFQTRSQTTGFHAHDRVVAGIEGLPLIENRKRHCILFQLSRLALRGRLHGKTEEAAQAFRIGEGRARKNFLELAGDRGLGDSFGKTNRRRFMNSKHKCFIAVRRFRFSYVQCDRQQFYHRSPPGR